MARRRRLKTTRPLLDGHSKMIRALELRKEGCNFEEIARQVGYSNKGAAYNAVQSALQSTLQEPADELRKLELERLDALLKGLWKYAADGDERAVDRVLKIMERRARLLGLDAVVKAEVKVQNVSAADALSQVEECLFPSGDPGGSYDDHSSNPDPDPAAPQDPGPL